MAFSRPRLFLPPRQDSGEPLYLAISAGGVSAGVSNAVHYSLATKALATKAVVELCGLEGLRTTHSLSLGEPAHTSDQLLRIAPPSIANIHHRSQAPPLFMSSSGRKLLRAHLLPACRYHLRGEPRHEG